MDTITKENDSWRDILKEHLKENWDSTLVTIVGLSLIGALLWFGINEHKKEAEQKALAEASRFEVQGVIERVREEHRVVKEGWFQVPHQYHSLYVAINGTEYKVNVDLEKYDFLKKGQEVIASGAEGQIDSLSISK